MDYWSDKKEELNEYSARGNQIERLVQGRLAVSEQNAEWTYEKEVKEVSLKNRYKYQDVNTSYKVGFLDDVKQLIFDPKRSADDMAMFTPESRWKLTGFETMEFQINEMVPSANYMRKRGIQGEEFNKLWGRVELEGKLNIKISESGYMSREFNLRKRAIMFYPPTSVASTAQGQYLERPELMIKFDETTFNFQSENDEFFSLKFGQKILKIKKENQSRQALKALERCLFICSFRGAFCLRNEVPAYAVQDYVVKEIDVIKGIDFVHENKIKDIVSSRYYKEAIGGFFYLLNKESFKRKTLSLEITFPKWLKPHFKTIPTCDLNAVTNVIPNKIPLMNLKIKLHESEITLLNENLKYIFPFKKEYLKRTLIVYESNLQDNQVKYMMNQISYPMHTIGLPKNQLSIVGLEYAINAAGTLYHEVIDFSYNSKLINISGPKVFKLTNANPSLKKLTLKGCYVLLGEEDQFFQGLSANMCLKEFQIDYMDSYNDAMIKHLSNYDAQLY